MTPPAGRIVITGAGGQVGTAVTAAAGRQGRDSAGPDVGAVGHHRRRVQPRGSRARRRGDQLCGLHRRGRRRKPTSPRAYAVNATGPRHLARACAQAGARLVHISTDYVFSGESAARIAAASLRARRPGRAAERLRPQQACGRAGGARRLAGGDGGAHRLGLHRAGGKDFVAVMRRLAAGDGTVDVVDDQIGSPTYAADLVQALLEVADEGSRSRLVHAANSGATSRFEQARAVFEGVGADPAAGAAGEHRPSSPAGPPARLLRAVRSAVRRRRPPTVAALAGRAC